jgi:hypothetical protein
MLCRAESADISERSRETAEDGATDDSGREHGEEDSQRSHTATHGNGPGHRHREEHRRGGTSDGGTPPPRPPPAEERAGEETERRAIPDRHDGDRVREREDEGATEAAERAGDQIAAEYGRERTTTAFDSPRTAR